MRVAFTLIGGAEWTGGHYYLSNLLYVLGQYAHKTLTPVLFVGEDCPAKCLGEFSAIPNIEIIRTSHLNVERKRSSLLQALLFGRDIEMRALFVAQGIDVVFEAARFFGWRLDIPAIAWIPDFQHRVLPHMFHVLARWKRELGFRAQVLGGRFIMLSSDDAREACERYYPDTIGRTYTVHFAVPSGQAIDREAARGIADLYKLPERFFFMPNQFWRHKNHILVVEALAILQQRGMSVTVAAPGRQNDPRDVGYASRLRSLVERLGVSENIRVLGMIPYEHISALMRSCAALLNPSLFEGWSTTVEEARSMGTPVILSDIAVHFEQMGASATYFDRYSPQSLADALQGFVPMDDVHREEAARSAMTCSEKRLARYSEDFVALVRRCVEENSQV
jgi:glycosyltransferase involved in cell wall biosynthesis